MIKTERWWFYMSKDKFNRSGIWTPNDTKYDGRGYVEDESSKEGKYRSGRLPSPFSSSSSVVPDIKDMETSSGAIQIRLLGDIMGDIMGDIAESIAFLSDWENYYNAHQVLQDIINCDKDLSPLRLFTIIKAAEEKRLRDLVPPEKHFKIMNFPGVVTEEADGLLRPIAEMMQKHEDEEDEKEKLDGNRQGDEELVDFLARNIKLEFKKRQETPQKEIENRIRKLKYYAEMAKSFESLPAYDCDALLKACLVDPLIPIHRYIENGRLFKCETLRPGD